MAKSILTAIVVLLLVHMLAAVGFFVYALGTGRLAPDRLDQYRATWRGEKLVPPSEEEAAVVVEDTRQDSAARIAASALQQEMLGREMQLQIQILRDMTVAVNAAQAKVNKERDELAKLKTLFDQQLTAQQQQAREEGFRKALSTYSSMKPKYVKDDFMNMSDEEVVRYLAAMKSDIATMVLECFKTPEEQTKRQRVMGLLEEQKKLDPFKDLNAKK